MADDSSEIGQGTGRSVGLISLPDPAQSPWWQLGKRLLLAFAILLSAPS